MNKIQHTPEIWINRARFHHIIIIVHPVDFEESQHWIAAKDYLE